MLRENEEAAEWTKCREITSSKKMFNSGHVVILSENLQQCFFH